MSRHVIQATKSELDDLSIMFDQYRQFYKMDTNIEATRQFVGERLSLHDSIIFACYSNFNALGFAQIYPSFSSVAMRRTWILNDLYVSKEHRGSGVATLLLNHIREKAEEAEVFSIKLVTAKDNLKAKSLYRFFGFEQNLEFDSYSIKI